ncbi:MULTISPECIES: hypothetical protein [Streptomyces]|uniref:Small hydrophilic protein n=1 Tax=Streptomyces lasiicapitis TaxID=1923961 RepID=A0ABQ2MF13_9ACTN|nr:MULTISPECIES: hypothetical protein [Streptomyces]QIB46305.1 hypothetical protein G3H79_27790 [Streptomyces aureoverticillatus]GGO50618.1 hypothetical protein GCM10012286_51450 [Streptomyces lasiicapitis]
MAKNKNRDRHQKAAQQNRGSQAESASEQARSAATEARQAMESQAQGSPAEVARKHQRRFGHN